MNWFNKPVTRGDFLAACAWIWSVNSMSETLGYTLTLLLAFLITATTYWLLDKWTRGVR